MSKIICILLSLVILSACGPNKYEIALVSINAQIAEAKQKFKDPNATEREREIAIADYVDAIQRRDLVISLWNQARQENLAAWQYVGMSMQQQAQAFQQQRQLQDLYDQRARENAINNFNQWQMNYNLNRIADSLEWNRYK